MTTRRRTEFVRVSSIEEYAHVRLVARYCGDVCAAVAVEINTGDPAGVLARTGLAQGGASYTPSFDPIPGLGPGNYMSWPPAPFSSFPYLKKVDDAGGIKKYEKAHLARLVAMLVPKFPQLPAEIVPNIVMHWAHVGDY